jgi:hypothetical protein
MLHTPKKRINKKLIAIIASALVVVVAGCLYLAHHYKIWPFQAAATTTQTVPITRKIDYSQPSTDQAKNGADIKGQVADGSKDGTTTQPPSTTQQNTLGVTITTVQPGQTVYIRAIIDSVISSGTCTLTMTGPNSKAYSATAPVQAMASSSTCQGFNVPMANLASGSWKITIAVTDGTHTGSATTEKTL